MAPWGVNAARTPFLQQNNILVQIWNSNRNRKILNYTRELLPLPVQSGLLNRFHRQFYITGMKSILCPIKNYTQSNIPKKRLSIILRYYNNNFEIENKLTIIITIQNYNYPRKIFLKLLLKKPWQKAFNLYMHIYIYILIYILILILYIYTINIICIYICTCI